MDFYGTKLGTTVSQIEQMSAVALRDEIAAGDLTATSLVERCIARIEVREAEVQAWEWFQPDYALAQAKALDEVFASGGVKGPLHGLPVGLKDVIDTSDAPTGNGCPVDAGRQPDKDARLVAMLRDAGAIIMGKTVSTELAFMHAGKTRNPHNPAHTPGGSSSGSCAAVGDGMIPLAVGTQTGGSVIRPASFCGITGFKPTFNAIPRAGVCLQSHTLDTVGVFGKTPADTALIASSLFQGDDFSADVEAMATPRFALLHPPGWDDATDDLHAAFARVEQALGERVARATLPPAFDDAADMRAIVNFAEMAHHYARYREAGLDRLGPETQKAMKDGAETSATDYIAALATGQAMKGGLCDVFKTADFLICPAATGPAPKGLAFTGDSIFNGLWTFCGTPAITVPIEAAKNGLPIGVQIVAAKGRDGDLLRAAEWLCAWNAAGRG